jgi:anti-sigma factor RsiW
MFDFLKRKMINEHEACRQDLSVYIDGRLTQRERARVERHLSSCASCREELSSLRMTLSLLRAVPALKPPRNFRLPASALAEQRIVRRQRLSYSHLRFATTVASVLLVLVVSGDALLQMGRWGAAAPAVGVAEPASRGVMAAQAPETVSATEDVAAPQALAANGESTPEATAGAVIATAEGQIDFMSAPTGVVAFETAEQPSASKAFGEGASPPAPGPVTAEVQPPSASGVVTTVAEAVATTTEVPLPTPEPVVPTAVPTATPLPRTPVPQTVAIPTPVLTEAREGWERDDRLVAPPQSVDGPRQTWQPLLRWIEAGLASAVALLLIAAWIVRHRLSAP